MHRYPDLSIAQRLALGFGLFFVIVAVLLVMVFRWTASSDLAQAQYSQRIAPLTEQAHSLERSVFQVAIHLRSVLLEPTAERLQTYRQSTRATQSNLQRLDASQLEADGKLIYDQIAQATRSYLSATDAIVEHRNAGPVGILEEVALSNQRRELIDRILQFVDLQRGKAEAALSEIATRRDQVSRGLAAGSLLAALMLSVLAVLTARSISTPARRLMRVAGALEAGDWKPALNLGKASRDVRIVRDEMQRLGLAFGAAAVALEHREQRLFAEGEVAKAIASSLHRGQVTDGALRAVIQHLQVELGIVYWAEAHSSALQPVASYAAGGNIPSVSFGDGLVGQAAQDRKLITIQDVPPDASFRIKLGYDEAPPRAVAAMPLMFADKLHGVLLVASLRPFTVDTLAFLRAAATQLGIGLQNVAAYAEIQTLLTDVRQRSETIQTQNEELQAQNEEIQAQNEEIQAQNEEIQAQSQQLQAQHEELQAQNEELIQQSEQLRVHAAMLTEADERKNKFLGVLAHELRNPMAPISNSIFILKRTDPGSERALRAQAVIERQTAHMVRLIDDLLDITRVSEGKIRIQRESLDLPEVVRACIEDHAAAFEEGAIALRLDLPDAPIIIDGDRTRLCQVLGNLLSNALKFTEHGGNTTLALRVDHQHQHAVIRLTDNGIGLEPELLSRLFQPFSQGSSELARSSGGLGLGLALVKALVTMHEGTVEARSDGAGRGSEFIVRLPLATSQTETERRSPSTAAISSAHAHPREQQRLGRVLVIEDNQDAAQSLRTALELEGYEVAVTYSGPEGLAHAETFRPDVVLCDVGLPGMDGYQVARRLRSHAQLRSVVLIALTGYAAHHDRQEATAAGFDLHLAKPLKLPELGRLIADARTRGRSAAKRDA
jgi:signal transduction histidine kinase/CheY-like chemotaxis protein